MIETKIKKCLKQIFPKETIPKNINTLKIGSFKKWDSLSHLNLLMLIEKNFKIKFTIDEMTSIKSMSQLIKILIKKK